MGRDEASHLATTRRLGTRLLWIGAVLAFTGLPMIILSWTVMNRSSWVFLLVSIACLNIVAGANFAWWGDRFRHYQPLFPSGAWGAAFVVGCLALSSIVAVAVLLYANYWMLSNLEWFQNR